MKTLRIGIIGAGGIVLHRHLPGLQKLPGLEIAAVANSSPASSKAFCEKHAPQAEPVGSWQELAARPDLDIVWIGATPYLHAPATVAALDAGKHVFCQARMSVDLAEAEKMASAATRHPELVTMLCPPPHGLRGDIFIKKLLADGILGAIRMIRLQNFNSAFLDPSKPAHWRQRIEISGLNIMTLGIHTEVMQRWFGDFDVTAAQGRTFTPVRDGYEVKIPDVLQVLARFENGAVGTLELSGVHSGEAVDALEVVGEKATLRYDYLREKISLWQAGANDWETLDVPKELEREWQVESDFINAVREPSAPRPHPDFTDGLRYMRVVQRVSDVMVRA